LIQPADSQSWNLSSGRKGKWWLRPVILAIREAEIRRIWG
jgi:hypothetical protein